ncbi:ATP-binding protein [Candidatus Amarolinea dominans]|uniref:ATP-binding protein n=1 Tax=Candidatus Amarolinea dominans TaxID=3140696 RepID=UPI001D899F18|nr:PAS domain S-box protein [Anaerolineae bacterium]
MFDHAHDGVFVADPSGVLCYVNARLAEMLGCAGAAELLGRPFPAAQWDTNPAFAEMWRQLLAQHHLHLPEVTLRTVDGRVLHVSWAAVCLRSATGDLLAVRGLLAEHAQHPPADNSAGDSYRLLAALAAVADATSSSLDVHEILDASLLTAASVMHAPIGIVRLLDAKGTSLVRAREFGIPAEVELPVRTPLCEGLLGTVACSGLPLLLDEASTDARAVAYERHLGLRSLLAVPLRTQARTVGVLALGARQPGHFTIEDVGVVLSLGLQIGAVVERAQLHQSVAEKERLLTQQIENARDPIINVDLQGYVTLFNHAAEELVGYARADVLEQPLARLVAPERSGAMLAALLGPTGDARTSDVAFITAAGEEVLLEVRVTPLMRAGERIGAQLIGRDVRARRRLEREKESFLATVSHDLQSPLAAIMGYAEFLLSGAAGHLTDTQMQFVEVILQSCRHQLALLRDLLEISRLESTRFQLEKNWVWLDQRLSWLVQAALPQALEKQVDLHAQLADNVPPVWADPNRIERVITNLISNAVKFTRARGRVVVRAFHDDELRAVRVEISDTGIGITPEDLPKLFDKYQRGRLSRAASEGTGLGLYIARGIIEAHGGEIGVESTPGKGSMFWFTLPTGAAPASAL